MSLSNDTLSALLDIKSQMKKWRLISIFLVVITIILLFSRNIYVQKTEKSLLDLDKNCIGEVEISGIILKDDYRDKVLKEIKKDKRVKALIVNVDSPGGGVVDSEMVYDLLRDISAKKPIVVLMNGMGTSGGYMVSLASDHIIARNGTLTGSIGVLLQSFEATELAKKVGIKFETYKSSELKGSPSPFEKTNPLVDKVIQESVDDIYDFFVELVAKRRKMDLKQAYEISNGQVYTGRQALKLKLVDEIGGKKEALSYLKSKGVNTDKLEVKEIDLKRPMSEFKIIDEFLGVFFKSHKNFLFKKNMLMFL